MFEKSDAAMDELTVDRAKRLTAIQKLTQVRKVTFWRAIIISLTQIPIVILSFYGTSSHGEWLNAFVLIMAWITFISFNSELRLLRVIEQLHQQSLRAREKEGPPQG